MRAISCLLGLAFITGIPEVTARAAGQTPPASAAVLIAAQKPSLSGWIRRNGTDAAWNVHDEYVEIAPGKGDILTKDKFGDFQLHVEFWIPLMANKKGQARGNSGVYLQGRYEIQVLDSYHNDTYVDGACGAIYKVAAPLVNACKAPTVWQSYDIEFTSPVCKDGKKIEPARMTVHLNGIKIH